MAEPLRSWWRNCALEPDPEIREIDRMEDGLVPLDPGVARVRELISGFELCHHKAERWIRNIIEAIGLGRSAKGLGTRPTGQWHPAETVWQSACDALSAWCRGDSDTLAGLSIGHVPAAQLLSGLGECSSLKVWQVQRVIEKIRSVIGWPQASDHPATAYQWLLLGGGEYEADYRSQCPARHRDHEEYWLATARTIIRDTHHGCDAELSLGLAIDMLWPCHWDFVANLQIVLDAIGGQLRPERPFAACGRNIQLVPGQQRLEVLCATLRAFWEGSEAEDAASEILDLLGGATPEKRWLAASLEKTIRLQLNPAPAMRAASSLAGPAWIKA